MDSQTLIIGSDYYEECAIITPLSEDFTKIPKCLDEDARVYASTKRYHRTHSIVDIVSFSENKVTYSNGDVLIYDYIALVIQ